MGKGLAGVMDGDGDHFVAEGIPQTGLSDSYLNTPYHDQLADLTVYDIASGNILASLTVVAPVYT
jgi:hypothetical protein